MFDLTKVEAPTRPRCSRPPQVLNHPNSDSTPTACASPSLALEYLRISLGIPAGAMATAQAASRSSELRRLQATDHRFRCATELTPLRSSTLRTTQTPWRRSMSLRLMYSARRSATEAAFPPKNLPTIWRDRFSKYTRPQHPPNPAPTVTAAAAPS